MSFGYNSSKIVKIRYRILGSQFEPHLTIGWFKKYHYGTRTVVCIQAGHINTSNIDFLVEL